MHTSIFCPKQTLVLEIRISDCHRRKTPCTARLIDSFFFPPIFYDYFRVFFFFFISFWSSLYFQLSPIRKRGKILPGKLLFLVVWPVQSSTWAVTFYRRCVADVLIVVITKHFGAASQPLTHVSDVIATVHDVDDVDDAGITIDTATRSIIGAHTTSPTLMYLPSSSKSLPYFLFIIINFNSFQLFAYGNDFQQSKSLIFYFFLFVFICSKQFACLNDFHQ